MTLLLYPQTAEELGIWETKEGIAAVMSMERGMRAERPGADSGTGQGQEVTRDT